MVVILLLLFSVTVITADVNNSNRQTVKTYSSSSTVSTAYSDNHATVSHSTSSSTSQVVLGNGTSNFPSNNGTLICGDNEVREECSFFCPSDYCPIADGQYQRCSIPNPCPPPICKCKFNYRRALNGKCIPTSECPPFLCVKPNEEYNPCPPYCPSDSCSMATPTGKCPLSGNINMERECRPTCRCKQGYWRNNDICVPYDQCPGVKI